MSEVEQIKAALDALLRAGYEHELQRPVGPIKFLTLSEMPQSAMEATLEEISKDPVRGANRLAIRALGERLFALLGSTDEMLAVAQEVAEIEHWGWRIGVIDKRWDGIGVEGDRWYC